MHLSSICVPLMLIFAGMAAFAWVRLIQERRDHIEARKKIEALKLTIVSLQERVQDERSGVAELFMRQPLGID